MIDVIVAIIEDTREVYYLSPGDFDLKKDDVIVLEDNGSLFIAKVIKEKYKEKKENLFLPLNSVLRLATVEDLKKDSKNKELSEKALIEAKKMSQELELDMNFIDSIFSLEHEQLIFTFLSENRVDFRTLAKKLAAKYKTRIELRQVGVRDKAKRIGGLGPCGLFLCCNSFLADFSSVSINMAKNQMLALNPNKINGVCGRLLCCLGYENEIYSDLKKDLPKIGSIVESSYGSGKVVSLNVFKRSYSLDLGDRGIVEIVEED